MIVAVTLCFAPHLHGALYDGAPHQDGCQISSVVDGDTVRLMCPSQTDTISGRLVGFDTPELRASCPAEYEKAIAAKRYLGDLLAAADQVDISLKGTDKYGRALINVVADGESIATHMIYADLARAYDGGKRVSWCN